MAIIIRRPHRVVAPPAARIQPSKELSIAVVHGAAGSRNLATGAMLGTNAQIVPTIFGPAGTNFSYAITESGSSDFTVVSALQVTGSISGLSGPLSTNNEVVGFYYSYNFGSYLGFKDGNAADTFYQLPGSAATASEAFVIALTKNASGTSTYIRNTRTNQLLYQFNNLINVNFTTLTYSASSGSAVPYFFFLRKSVPQSLLFQLVMTPLMLLQPRRIIIPTATAAIIPPTLLAASATSITTSSAIPRVTFTRP